MTPGGRLAAAIECLDEIVGGSPAERALTRWARASRFAGSKDRAAVRDLVFDTLRRRRSCLWCSGAGAETGRALIIGLLAQDRPEELALFDGEGHAPPPLTPDERAMLRPDTAAAPGPVRLDYPDFLHDELVRSLGPDLEAVMNRLRQRAPVDLRVNTLRTTPDDALAALAEDAVAAEPVAGVPGALRVTRDPRRVAASRAYRDGLVELQDAASQLVSLAAGAAPGMTVLDLCAGGGGKTLALAAQMRGRGTLYAYDANPSRMRDLPGRAARAGARLSIADDAALAARAGSFDLVVVDAPCSGTGAWRRNPDAKWRMAVADLQALATLQAEILDRACDLAAPGGTVFYATCSLLRDENADRIGALRQRRPGFVQQDSAVLLPESPGDGFYLSKNIMDRHT